MEESDYFVSASHEELVELELFLRTIGGEGRAFKDRPIDQSSTRNYFLKYIF